MVVALRERCGSVERVAAMARDEASSEETRSEGKYDTRATEASFLARGQAERVDDLRRARSWAESAVVGPSEAVEVGALLEVRLRGRTELLFLAPMSAAGVEVEGRTVRVIAAGSPLGAALSGAVTGDELEVDGPGGWATCEVLGVC